MSHKLIWVILTFECVVSVPAAQYEPSRVHRVCLSFFSQTLQMCRMPTGDVKHTFNVRSMTISASFILLYMYPPFSVDLCAAGTLLCAQFFSRWNGWIGSGVAALLITDWPCGIYIIMAGWPHSIHSSTPQTHSLLKINRLHCLLNGSVCCENTPKVLWLNANVLLARCNMWDAAAAEQSPKS